ncbi:hypothetical protein DXV75_08135 [Alteromonas aestuariivivens]|uniref:Tetratricopeptide repeat protein n=1 Tax=Alteromonas aestuariivivens TaxID=1938339 RepID=A0A3D8M840_9ALTE|nr:hypothetical protein [Alteromonas aestuariivivens]RDV26041.1 hypothetical protein DXV75_08135 [Alteromonas aestuariivivens]
MITTTIKPLAIQLMALTFTCLLSTSITHAQTNKLNAYDIEVNKRQSTDLHEVALQMKAFRANQKKMVIFRPNNEENREFNQQTQELVALSKNALSSNVDELNQQYSQIENWFDNRSTLTGRKEESLLFHTVSVQIFLLQKQGKNSEIVDLIMARYGTLDLVPKGLKHRTAVALSQLHQTETASEMLQQLDSGDRQTPLGVTLVRADTYSKLGDYETALNLIDQRLASNGPQEAIRLLTLKYQVLNSAGYANRAEQIKQTLKVEFRVEHLAHSNPYQNPLSLHWAPVLDYI